MSKIIELGDDGFNKLNELGINYTLRNDLASKLQQSELDKRDWVVIPYEFTGGEYSARVNPARISYCPAVEKAGKELCINYLNTGKDSLGREFVGNNTWGDSIMLNVSMGVRAITPREKVDYLHLLVLGSQDKADVYDTSGKRIDSKLCEKYLLDSIEKTSPGRAEWIDAEFKASGSERYILFKHNFLTKKGDLIGKKERIEEDTLMKGHFGDFSEISFDDWVKNHTRQGLPRANVKRGDFSYTNPREDTSVIRMFANSGGTGLFFSSSKSLRAPSLGIRSCESI